MHDDTRADDDVAGIRNIIEHNNLKYYPVKKQFFFLIIFTLWYSASHGANGTLENTRFVEKQVEDPVRVFARGEQGYELFRIPALVKTTDGTLLLFAEARKLASAGDRGDIDLVLKRSADNGKTWSEMITIWDEGVHTCGNPVPVVDQNTGIVHLLMMLNNRQVFTSRSSDNGLSWEQPHEITSSVKPEGWGFYATGPVHGLQIKHGPHKGRLIIPTYANIPMDGVTKHHSFCLYSDDEGKTWIRGGLSPQDNVGECTIVELSDGRLMLNMRSKLPYRSVAYSDDGGSSWYGGWHDTTLIDPPCQAALLDIVDGGEFRLLYSNPASNKRENITIRISYDDGVTWPKSKSVYSGPSAYTDMVILNDEFIGIVFESGVKSPHGHIFFNQVALSQLK